MVIVVNHRQAAQFQAAIAAAFPELEVITCDPSDPQVLSACLSEATVLVSNGSTANIDFHHLPKLRWIQSFSAGVNHLLPRLPHTVKLCRGLGVHDTAMAEHCLARMLAHEHGLLTAWDNQKQRLWGRYPTGRIAGKVLGIAGLGSIGQALAKRAVALDMEVLGLRSQPQATPGVSRVYGPEQLPKFLSPLDYLAIFLPLTDATRGMFGKRQFALMKETSAVINVGRGAVINEGELIEALKQGRPAHALLDVFTQEPLPDDSPLWDLPNVTITPHNAGGSVLAECVELFMSNLTASLSGQPLQGVADPGRQY